MSSFEKIKRSFDLMNESHESMKESARVLSGGPSSYHFKRVEGYVQALFGRFAPFKIGDKVEIIKPPNCNNGWSHCKHFLVKGATGIVRDVDYRDDQFTAYVEWDNETWISTLDNKEHPVESKHLFLMRENQIKRLNHDN